MKIKLPILSPDSRNFWNVKRSAHASMSEYAVLLNIASAVLAQKHLADISQNLTEIVEAVPVVSAFQNNARKSEIVGTIQYLQKITPTVPEGQCRNYEQDSNPTKDP